MIGQTFGSLTVTSAGKKDARRIKKHWCLCSCGRREAFRWTALTGGKRTACRKCTVAAGAKGRAE